ncbi:hypothetical protein JM18_002611 [Phytophthora kernoviae]|uniref:Amino acid permease/ SLC12A domain-containing protein n=1 Tax=Phytophthora kernoviae TaxID=325452 RepID=A0A921VB69_9STRA|nr:hypothetical protein JM18_002611 [Phytophthora kernoviae]
MIEPSLSLYDRRQAGLVNHRRLGVVGIVSILYVYLCSGPIGSESIISSGGPLVGLLAILLYSLLVGFPFAYIVAELCSAFPEDGGFTIWVLHAFGPFWGFQVGYWSWIAGILRGALMPGTLLSLLATYFNIECKSVFVEYLTKAAIAIILSIPTFLGTCTVARLSIAVTVIILLFFTIFTIWALVNFSDIDDLLEIRRENIKYDADLHGVVASGETAIQWVTLFNSLFFKFKGINNASVFGGEVKNPAGTYLRAIVFTFVLMVVTYIVPITAGLTTDALPWLWLDRDSFPFFAYFVGGRFLRGLIQIAACCGSAATCMAAIYVKTFLVSGMGECGLVPTALAKRSTRFQSPTNSALLTLLPMLVLLSLDFDHMLPMTNAYSSAVQLLIIMTIINLRRELPYIPRPIKVPGGVPMLCAIAVIPTFMFGYITFYAFSNLVSGILMLVFFIPGFVYAVNAIDSDEDEEKEDHSYVDIVTDGQSKLNDSSSLNAADEIDSDDDSISYSVNGSSSLLPAEASKAALDLCPAIDTSMLESDSESESEESSEESEADVDSDNYDSEYGESVGKPSNDCYLPSWETDYLPVDQVDGIIRTDMKELEVKKPWRSVFRCLDVPFGFRHRDDPFDIFFMRWDEFWHTHGRALLFVI